MFFIGGRKKHLFNKVTLTVVLQNYIRMVCLWETESLPVSFGLYHW